MSPTNVKIYLHPTRCFSFALPSNPTGKMSKNIGSSPKIFACLNGRGDFMLFKPENVREDLWKKLLDKMEEKVRSKIWSMLPGRWRLEEEFRSVNHEASHIACQDREVMWMVSTVEDENLKLHMYKVTEF